MAVETVDLLAAAGRAGPARATPSPGRSNTDGSVLSRLGAEPTLFSRPPELASPRPPEPQAATRSRELGALPRATTWLFMAAGRDIPGILFFSVGEKAAADPVPSSDPGRNGVFPLLAALAAANAATADPPRPATFSLVTSLTTESAVAKNIPARGI